LGAFAGVTAVVQPGPFTVHRPIPRVTYGVRSTAFGMGAEAVSFPAGAYLLLAQDLGVEEFRSVARSRAVELAALVDLEFEGLLVEQVFDGVVTTPTSALLIQERPFRVRSGHEFSSDALAQTLAKASKSLQNSGDRERLALMARWYRRGEEAANSIDQFLFYYIALETYPAAGTTDVPNTVRDFLVKWIAPTVAPGVLKARLLLGPICGLRGNIVHDGRDVVGESDRAAFDVKLECLRAVTRTCLAHLAGLPYSGELDKWLTQSA
jgi:hypothetical protein